MGEFPRVNPGLCFFGHFGPQIGNDDLRVFLSVGRVLNTYLRSNLQTKRQGLKPGVGNGAGRLFVAGGIQVEIDGLSCECFKYSRAGGLKLQRESGFLGEQGGRALGNRPHPMLVTGTVFQVQSQQVDSQFVHKQESGARSQEFRKSSGHSSSSWDCSWSLTVCTLQLLTPGSWILTPVFPNRPSCHFSLG